MRRAGMIDSIVSLLKEGNKINIGLIIDVNEAVVNIIDSIENDLNEAKTLIDNLSSNLY